ncbi:MAG: site-specific integrase [Acidobacteria bacterium]|nr:site-specific integrase [Acidobacteriota bacterium]
MRVYREQKSGRWYVDYFFRGKRLQYKAGSSRRAAERLQLRIENEINAGKHNPAALRQEIRGTNKAGLTLGKLTESFLRHYRSRGRTGYYEEKARGWLRYFGPETLVADIDALKVQRYRNARIEQVSPSMVRKDLISLGTMFRWAQGLELVKENPAEPLKVKRPPEPAGTSRALTRDEYDRLIAVCPNWLVCVIGWACHTGVDKGVTRRLRWSGLNLQYEGRRIVSGSFKFLRSKTGKAVRQELSRPVLEALNQARKVRHASGTVFLDDRSQPIDEKALDWALGKAFKAAGLQGFNFRSFRHTYATWALRAGVHPSVLGKMMGHSTAFIVDRYLHVGDDLLKQAAELLGVSYMGERKNSPSEKEQ